ncbi:hypothetical protein [Sphingobium sp.]|uniref:hypothetical protein n=1 Tax=Sphingobium sp. TaxID=1912891 RepID=UPI0035C77CD6
MVAVTRQAFSTVADTPIVVVESVAHAVFGTTTIVSIMNDLYTTPPLNSKLIRLNQDHDMPENDYGMVSDKFPLVKIMEATLITNSDQEFRKFVF